MYSAYDGCVKRIFTADDRRDLFNDITIPTEELLGDVFERGLGMLTSAIRHPEKFQNWGSYKDINACIQCLE